MAANNSNTRRGAPSNRLATWVQHHRDVARQSLGRLLTTPVATAVTVAVMAITLALPACLGIAIDNARLLTGKVYSGMQVTVYLEQSVAEFRARELRAELAGWEPVEGASLLTSAQALQQFRAQSDVAELLDSLPANPLPATIVLQVRASAQNAVDIEQLVRRLEAIDDVEAARYDLAWLRQLKSLVLGAQYLASGFAVILGLGVILVVGNTIRLAVDIRKDEIIVTKLIGATNSFVTRPFLYMGVWLGLAGGVVAFTLIVLGSVALQSALDDVARQFDTAFSLSTAGWRHLGLLPLGTALGWLGAFSACQQQIRKLEPQ